MRWGGVYIRLKKRNVLFPVTKRVENFRVSQSEINFILFKNFILIVKNKG